LQLRLTTFDGQRFRKDEKSVRRVQKAKPGCNPKRQARIHVAEPSTDGWSEMKPKPKAAQESHSLSSVFPA